MNRINRSALVGVSTALALMAVGTALAQKPKMGKMAKKKPTMAVGYAKTEAVLKARCVGCHNGPGGKAGVNLASYAAVVGGKWREQPLVVAKKPQDSVLVKAVHGEGMDKMPPGGSLAPGDMKTIETWIAAGAKK